MKPITVLALSVAASLAVSAGLGIALIELDAPASAQTTECTLPARALVRHELVFGTARPHGAPIGEDEWQSFVDSVVLLASRTGSPSWTRAASGAAKAV